MSNQMCYVHGLFVVLRVTTCVLLQFAASVGLLLNAIASVCVSFRCLLVLPSTFLGTQSGTLGHEFSFGGCIEGASAGVGQDSYRMIWCGIVLGVHWPTLLLMTNTDVVE